MLRILLVMLLGGVGTAAAETRSIAISSVADTSTTKISERRANTAAVRRAVQRLDGLVLEAEAHHLDITVVKTHVEPVRSGRAIATAEIRIVFSDARGAMHSVASGKARVELPGSLAHAARGEAIDAAVESVVGKARQTIAMRATR